MKRKVWTVVLAATLMTIGTAAVAQPKHGDGPPNDEEMRRRSEKDQEIRHRQAKMEHDKRQREMEIEQRKMELDRHRDDGDRGPDPGGCILLLLVLVVHILLTIWVCKDMREQGIGRALWVPIVLLAGILGAILYAIARVGNLCGKAGGGK